jgi:uncharacterized membrane protein
MSVATIPVGWHLLIAVAIVPLLIDAARRAGWRAEGFQSPRVWLLATLAVLIAHRGVIETQTGFTLHYLGGAALTLVAGYPRALLSMTLVVTVDAILGHGNLPLAPAIALGGVLPVWLTFSLYAGSRRWLPSNPFVFLLGSGFIGLFVVYAIQSWLTVLTWRFLLPVVPVDDQSLLAYAMLLSWGETLLEGMIVTVMVVYLPGSIRLFDDQHYLHNAGRRPPS